MGGWPVRGVWPGMRHTSHYKPYQTFLIKHCVLICCVTYTRWFRGFNNHLFLHFLSLFSALSIRYTHRDYQIITRSEDKKRTYVNEGRHHNNSFCTLISSNYRRSLNSFFVYILCGYWGCMHLHLHQWWRVKWWGEHFLSQVLKDQLVLQEVRHHHHIFICCLAFRLKFWSFFI